MLHSISWIFEGTYCANGFPVLFGSVADFLPNGVADFILSCGPSPPASSSSVSFLPFPEWVPLLIFSSLMSPGMPPRPCPYQPFILKISFSSIHNSLRRETFSDLYFKPVSLTWVSFLHNPHRNQNQAKIYYYDHFIESLCPGKGL